MQFLVLLFLAASTIITARPGLLKGNKNHMCYTIEECHKKCEHGEYHELWNKTLSTYELRCDGKHSDYRYIHGVCRQEMSGDGTHIERSKKSCDLVGGLYCKADFRRPGLKWKWLTLNRCIMEEQYFPEFFADCITESWNMDAFVALTEVPWDCYPDYLE